MPQVQPEHKSLPLKWKIMILVMVFVLAGGGGAALLLYQRDQDRKAVKGVLDQRQALVLRGKYDEALKKLREVYPRAHSQEEQEALWYYQGTVNLTKGDLKTARLSYKEYEARAGLNSDVAQQLGYIADQQGDKAEAIDYYQKAIKLMADEGNPLAEDEAVRLNARIAELQK